MLMMMMSEILYHEFLTKISLTTQSIAVHNFGTGIPCGPPPLFFVGMPLCPGCHLVLVLWLC